MIDLARSKEPYTELGAGSKNEANDLRDSADSFAPDRNPSSRICQPPEGNQVQPPSERMGVFTPYLSSISSKLSKKEKTKITCGGTGITKTLIKNVEEGGNMLLWSRGLGKRIVWLDLSKLEPYTVDEVTEDLPKAVRENLEEKTTEDSIALTGGRIKPVGWDFVITINKEDIIGLVNQLLMDELYDLGVEVVYSLLLNVIESRVEGRIQEQALEEAE
ncbi:hypothetical protein AKJ61_03330 [candidate division MSBL1 archaeon SCGC-AAA259B11]|uniref:Uncharacterized protein n=1 Tax=candidate division MSBL1 archaeon SCGC-AAA259B11 TaxID=1698260 RepID=A0A133U4V0_9EURY|nr:hypothetical protein AKJ61_03330 [candidate division MSBL1 archaeon SCGC-AAA259B11]